MSDNRSPPDSPSVAVVRAVSAKDGPAVRRVLARIAEGSSVRDACRRENVSRRSLFRRLDKDAELREQMAATVAMRAHVLFDEMLEIADGKASATALAERIASAVGKAAPEKTEAVVRALAREQIQRDRLAWDARRWAASRLLPTVYGAQAAAAPGGKEHHVRISFDPLPTHAALPPGGEAPEADYEVL